jgi:hypothetical protein
MEAEPKVERPLHARLMEPTLAMELRKLQEMKENHSKKKLEKSTAKLYKSTSKIMLTNFPLESLSLDDNS